MVEKLMTRNTKNKRTNSQAIQEPTGAADIAIDFPREEELVNPGHYAIRISGVPNAEVQISINNGEWQGCRASIGHYWFDWAPAKAGEVVINARQRVGKGRWKSSDQRFCRIVGPKKF
jgi:hypothetical protein